MFLGAVLALFLVDSKNVIRHDGSKVIVMKHPTWTTEIRGLYEVLRNDTYIIALFPMFFVSNWFYSVSNIFFSSSRDFANVSQPSTNSMMSTWPGSTLELVP